MPFVNSILALIAVSLPPAVDERYRRTIAGPAHYCGNVFALNLARDERIVWRFPVHDFVLHDLVSARGSFTVYEGNFPSKSGKSRDVVKVVGLKRVERLRDPEGGVSYLIATKEKWPAYVHVIGKVWKGNASDFFLLSRLKMERGKGCKEPTFKMNS